MDVHGRPARDHGDSGKPRGERGAAATPPGPAGLLGLITRYYRKCSTNWEVFNFLRNRSLPGGHIERGIGGAAEGNLKEGRIPKVFSCIAVLACAPCGCRMRDELEARRKDEQLRLRVSVSKRYKSLTAAAPCQRRHDLAAEDHAPGHRAWVEAACGGSKECFSGRAQDSWLQPCVDIWGFPPPTWGTGSKQLGDRSSRLQCSFSISKPGSEQQKCHQNCSNSSSIFPKGAILTSL